MLITLKQNNLHINFFLREILYNCFKFIQPNLNERDKARKCYNCLKLMIGFHLKSVQNGPPDYNYFLI